ncbi:MAG: ketoacyl-ACP synthase III [Myxococcaceae bacterium]|nr:ketoacyl-ACP synthase III [Myxococcaceae bacterium]
MRAHIIGTGSYVPEKVLTNRDLEKIVETSDEWIVERTGIRERHMAAPDETTSDMAVKAAIRALELANTRADELELIVVGTISPDMPMPACAAFVAHKLGATKAFAFDLSAACAGSLFGLSVAAQFVETGRVKRALVIGVELLTRIVDWKDRNTCVLFGDAAGAMVVGPSPEPSRGLISTHLHTDGSQTGILCIPGGGSKTPVSKEMVEQRLQFVSMNGRDVYKFAVRALSDAVNEAFAANGLTADQITHVVAHQANVRIIDAVLERVKLPREKAFLNIDKYGNTSSASLPMTLDEASRAGRLKPNDTILMMAIGAGMSWGSAIVRW